jgi:RNA processing factor Prp31
MSKSKVSLNANQISQKWNRRMKGAVSDIQAGVDAVTENPAEKAIQKQDKMLQNLTKAVNDGRWAAGLNNVSLSDWKSKTKEKVGQRLASGVDGAMDKRQKFDTYLVNTMNQILPTIQNMPDMTFEDSVNKVRAVMEHMHNNPYKK